MLIYSLIFIVLLFGVFHFDYKKNHYFRNSYYFFIFIICTLMMGLRYKVGGDSITYENVFRFLPHLDNYFQYITGSHNTNNFQPGYLFFVALCKVVSDDYYFYQFIHAIIFNSIYFWFVMKYSRQPFTAIFIAYVFIVYFYLGFEVQREMFAICCFLLSYKYFLKNKWIPYYIFCFIGFSFHISAAFLLILPFAKILRLSASLIIISLVVSVPILVARMFFIDFIKVLLFTEAMQKKGEGYSEIEFSILGTIFFYFVRVIVFIPFLLYYAKNKGEEKKYDWMLISILWISILSQVMIGFDRLNNYLYIPLIVFLSNFLYNETFEFKSHLAKKIVVSSSFLFLFSIIWIKFFTANIDNKYFFYKVYFPYESVLDKKVTEDRELYLRKMWRHK